MKDSRRASNTLTVVFVQASDLADRWYSEDSRCSSPDMQRKPIVTGSHQSSNGSVLCIRVRWRVAHIVKFRTTVLVNHDLVRRSLRTAVSEERRSDNSMRDGSKQQHLMMTMMDHFVVVADIDWDESENWDRWSSRYRPRQERCAISFSRQ